MQRVLIFSKCWAVCSGLEQSTSVSISLSDRPFEWVLLPLNKEKYESKTVGSDCLLSDTLFNSEVIIKSLLISMLIARIIEVFGSVCVPEGSLSMALLTTFLIDAVI